MFEQASVELATDCFSLSAKVNRHYEVRHESHSDCLLPRTPAKQNTALHCGPKLFYSELIM